MKQYTIDFVYLDNYEITAYNNGKMEYSDIVRSYELDGYVSALETQGYRREVIGEPMMLKNIKKNLTKLKRNMK